MNPRKSQPSPQLAIAARFRSALFAVALVGLVTAIAMHGYALRELCANHRRDRLVSVATVAAARLDAVESVETASNAELITNLEDKVSDVTASVRELAAAIVKLDRIDSVAITDSRGVIVFQWPESGKQHDAIVAPGPTTQATLISMKLAGGITLDGAVAPIVASDSKSTQGYVCVLSANEADAAATMKALTLFAGVVGGASLISALVSIGYFKQRVFAPLAQILRTGARDGDQLPVDRPDEFGEIARHLERLNVDLDRARNDATRLERSIETTVHRETKQISNQLRRAERAAEVDALTGLANRRFIEQRLEAVYSEQVARGVNLAIVMLDVDNFKALNDSAGHAAGDALLRFIGELLAGTLREQDVGVRFGGDEFAMILVDVPGTQARNIAERTIKIFARQTSAAKLPTTVTLSAGIASLDEVNVRSGAELMARADDALYESKNKGKNLVIAATDAEPRCAQGNSSAAC